MAKSVCDANDDDDDDDDIEEGRSDGGRGRQELGFEDPAKEGTSLTNNLHRQNHRRG